MYTISLVILSTALAAFCAATTYRYWWKKRYGTSPCGASGARRLRGGIAGPGAPGTPIRCEDGCSFELVADDGARHTVRVDGGSVAHHATLLRVGDRVTVDGLMRAVPAATPEALYRHSARVPGIDATRIVRGTWPSLRWSLTATSLLGAAAGVAAVAFALAVPPREALVQETASRTACPEGTVRETRVGPDGVLHRCRDAQGRLHGAYTLWSWSGALVERGNFFRGQRHGVRDLLLPELDQWILRRTTYAHGRRHGPTYEMVDPGGLQLRRYHAEYMNGKLHGVERGWYPDGGPASLRYYQCGEPCGRWTYWTEKGSKIYLAPFPQCSHHPEDVPCVLAGPRLADQGARSDVGG